MRVTNPFGPGGPPRTEGRPPADAILGRFLRRLRRLGATDEQLAELTDEWPSLDDAVRAAVTTADDATLRSALAGEDPLLDEDDD